MKLNMDLSRPRAFLDFETQSEAELNHGLRKYMKHPSTKALTCVVSIDGCIHKFDDPHNQKDRLQSILCSRVVVAHNAPFDAAVHEDVLGLPPVEWFDTLPCARAAGLPGNLDKLSLAVGGRGKDKNGEQLINLLCILKPGQRPPAKGAAHELLMDYNVQDVEELELVFDKVKGFGEPDVIAVDRKINERAIPMDRSFLEILSSLFVENAKRFGDKFAEHTEGVNPRSPKKLREWLEGHGVTLPSLNKPTVTKFLESSDDFVEDEAALEVGAMEAVKEALELRRELVGVGRGKVDAALRLIGPDDCIPDQFVYFGAHTGRWTSRGLQLHNMPNSSIAAVDIRAVEPTYEALYALAMFLSAEKGLHITVADCLNVMIRRAVKADNLNVADYGAVEARCLAWIADESGMLAAYKDPNRSLYLDMGQVIFGCRIDKKRDPMKYVLAKSLVLGCGYGMSGEKFRMQLMLRQSKEFIRMLNESGLDLRECVKTYRKTYPGVPAIWKKLGEALKFAVDGIPVEIARCFFQMVGPDLHCILPSGRPIVYRNARFEMVVPTYCAMYGMPEVPVQTVVFDRPNRGGVVKGYLWGSRMCENICQAICRDLVADSLVKCDQEGLDVIMHVHDEIVSVGPQGQLDILLDIMSTGPAWAEGFPILVEGYSGAQWSKHTKGYLERKMLGGLVV